MGLFSALHLAVTILLAHKGRSALTSLGIAVGITGVVAMVAVGKGAQQKLDARLESAGKNLSSSGRAGASAPAFSPITTP
jgi:ABC-type antimicrobial peptide transport system permease subunit